MRPIAFSEGMISHSVMALRQECMPKCALQHEILMCSPSEGGFLHAGMLGL